MSGSSVIKDSIYILKEVGGHKLSSGMVFILDIEVLQFFTLDLFMSVDITLELEIKEKTTGCI